MNQYDRLLKVLKDGGRELPHAPAPAFPAAIPQWVEAIPFVEIAAATDACREFAATRKWPQMKDSVLAQVHLRLEAAADLFRTDAARGADDEIPDDELIELALTDFWLGQAIPWARQRYGQRS